MNREQKAAAIEEIATNIRESEAVFAVDYRGLSVPQIGELRTRLRAADARFTVVKNTLTERAADQADAEALKGLLEGPTALAFVRGDAAAAAKALRDYARETDLVPFKGGLMEGNALTPEDIGQIARLPSRDVLYQQLVGVVAHPISGLARTLNALIGGLAIALGQVQEKGLVGGNAPAPEAAAEPAAAEESAPADETAAQVPTESAEEPTAETPTEEAPSTDDDPDAGPAGDPEPAQPNQAEGADTPEETS
jgi:large subunit ribosomal protein L10